MPTRSNRGAGGDPTDGPREPTGSPTPRAAASGAPDEPDEVLVDPALAPWDPPAPPTIRQRAASGALAAAMLGLGEVLEPSKRREEAPIEAEAPGEPDDGYELVFDPDDPTRLTVVVAHDAEDDPGVA